MKWPLLTWLTVLLLGVVLLGGCEGQKPARPTESPRQPAPPANDAPQNKQAARAELPAKAEAKPEPAPAKTEPETSPAPRSEPVGKTAEAESDQPSEPKEPDLGPPLVEHPERLKRLDPTAPVFIDKEKKRVVLVGQICQRQVPLEMFACLRHTKEHEAIVTLATKAMLVHAALLAVGAEPGEPAHFSPTFSPAHGQEIEIEVLWRDAKGQIRKARAQDWVKNGSTGKSLDQPWVFAGSGFWTDPNSGERHYQAESGDLICVSNFSSATLDLTIQSSSSNDSLSFEAFTERIPPKGTPVTLVLTPQKKKH